MIENTAFKLVLKNDNMSTKQKEILTKVGKILMMIFTYLFLAIMAFMFIFPFYWMLITSLKTGDEIRGTVSGMEGVQTFWPHTIMWSNYTSLFGEGGFNFGLYLRNTLIVGVLSTLGTLITTILAAFAFSRLKFRGRDLMFSIFLATMMIPGEMMVITNYVTVSNLGMTDYVPGSSMIGPFAAMIVPFLVSVYYIYLLRQNFRQIPNELYLAAKVDGKTDWQYLWKVMVPLAMPTLITIFILKLMGAWNSYVWPNLIANGEDNLKLMTNGLRDSFQTGTDFDEYGRQMAATVLVTVPLLLLFIFFRKYIMRGVGRAGIKG